MNIVEKIINFFFKKKDVHSFESRQKTELERIAKLTPEQKQKELEEIRKRPDPFYSIPWKISENEVAIFLKAKDCLIKNPKYKEYEQTCLEAKMCPRCGGEVVEEFHAGMFKAVFNKCKNCDFDKIKPNS